MFHPRMAAPIGNRQIDRVFRRILTEQFAPLRTEARNAFFAERNFGDGAEGQRGAFGGTALGGGIEDPDRLDGVAE